MIGLLRPGQEKATVSRAALSNRTTASRHRIQSTCRRGSSLNRKLSSQLSHKGIESSGLFGGFWLLVLRRVWIEGDGGYEAPIACLS
jgi:hypothetical protein